MNQTSTGVKSVMSIYSVSIPLMLIESKENLPAGLTKKSLSNRELDHVD